MVAKTDIDNTMSFVLPSLESVINLTGKNLVLLDGKTFQKISKMLFFKNKERNLIDSLGVNVVVIKGGKGRIFQLEIGLLDLTNSGQSLNTKFYAVPNPTPPKKPPPPKPPPPQPLEKNQSQ